MLYLLIIAVCIFVLSVSLKIIYGVTFLYGLGYTCFAVLCVVLIDALVATAARLLPKSFADHEKKIFQVSAKEKRFYEKLKIRKWKDKVPEIGQFTGFRKNKLESPRSVEYVDRFLLEACYGEIGHFFSAVFGFILLLLSPSTHIWGTLAFGVAFINLLLNLPSLFILRYTTYKLRVLRNSNIRRIQREHVSAEK